MASDGCLLRRNIKRLLSYEVITPLEVSQLISGRSISLILRRQPAILFGVSWLICDTPGGALCADVYVGRTSVIFAYLAAEKVALWSVKVRSTGGWMTLTKLSYYCDENIRHEWGTDVAQVSVSTGKCLICRLLRNL